MSTDVLLLVPSGVDRATSQMEMERAAEPKHRAHGCWMTSASSSSRQEEKAASAPEPKASAFARD